MQELTRRLVEPAAPARQGARLGGRLRLPRGYSRPRQRRQPTGGWSTRPTTTSARSCEEILAPPCRSPLRRTRPSRRKRSAARYSEGNRVAARPVRRLQELRLEDETPYVTECPYCGRVRKRAPKIDRDAEAGVAEAAQGAQEAAGFVPGDRRDRARHEAVRDLRPDRGVARAVPALCGRHDARSRLPRRLSDLVGNDEIWRWFVTPFFHGDELGYAFVALVAVGLFEDAPGAPLRRHRGGAYSSSAAPPAPRSPRHWRPRRCSRTRRSGR